MKKIKGSKNNENKQFEQIVMTRNACLQNADDLIIAAKLLQNKHLQHIQYHLSVLALEEIGKAEIIGMTFAAIENS